MDQDKRVVIISGMRLATAKMLLDGARTLVTGRSEAGLDSARQELGDGTIVVSSDARSLTDIDVIAAQVKAEFDTFDLGRARKNALVSLSRSNSLIKAC